MRSLLLLLFACSDPADQQAHLPAPAAGPPITPGFSFIGPPVGAPGLSLTLIAELPAGSPADPVWLALGTGGVGAGPCLAIAGNPCLDVKGSVQALGQATPSSDLASWTLSVPASAPPGTYGIQALQNVGGTWRLSTPASLTLSRCGDGQLQPGETCLTDTLVSQLRLGPAAAQLAISRTSGWPVAVEHGLLFATSAPGQWSLAGDLSAWSPVRMNADAGFRWVVQPASGPSGYKFTNGSSYRADPLSRAYTYDSFGEISLLLPSDAHLERLFEVSDGVVGPRTVRAWIPQGPPTHVLYAEDGQNLFNPGAIWGGWHLQDAAPPGMMIVGIDNTAARMDEYTHVIDDIGGGPIGGDGDLYADFVHHTVRDLVDDTWGEPAKVGLLGSSLGGLISFHIADRYPSQYLFAGSMSGTMGWGSIGLHRPTMIERYAAAGHRSTVLFLDSGGGGSCFDSDADGIEDDDPSAADDFCENRQFADVLDGVGYDFGVDLHHWWEPGASHDEAAWAARVWRPLAIFAAL